MRKLFTALALLTLLASRPATAAISIVKATVVSITQVDIEPVACGPNSLCDGGHRITLAVGDLLRGPGVGATATVFLTLHMRSYPQPKETVLVVLEGVGDEATRRILQADYWVRDIAVAREHYCLFRKPSEWGLPISDQQQIATPHGPPYCFDGDALRPTE